MIIIMIISRPVEIADVKWHVFTREYDMILSVHDNRGFAWIEYVRKRAYIFVLVLLALT